MQSWVSGMIFPAPHIRSTRYIMGLGPTSGNCNAGHPSREFHPPEIGPHEGRVPDPLAVKRHGRRSSDGQFLPRERALSPYPCPRVNHFKSIRIPPTSVFRAILRGMTLNLLSIAKENARRPANVQPIRQAKKIRPPVSAGAGGTKPCPVTGSF